MTRPYDPLERSELLDKRNKLIVEFDALKAAGAPRAQLERIGRKIAQLERTYYRKGVSQEKQH